MDHVLKNGLVGRAAKRPTGDAGIGEDEVDFPEIFGQGSEDRYRSSAVTGSLSFAAADPLEFVHCHIARQPTPIAGRWKGIPSVDEFRLGEQDTPDRLVIPEKLYGRDCEIEVLLAAFERIAAGGRPESVVISGYSGVGKSSVVNELHTTLVPARGLFAPG